MLEKLKNLKQVNIIQLLKLQKYTKQLIFLMAAVAFVLLNSILAPVALRLDLSQGQAYTLSKSTKNLIKKIDKPTTITFFVTSDLPTQLLPLKSDVADLLQEYEKQGKNITVNIVDPKTDSTALQNAQQLGIPQVQFSQLENDKYAVTASFFGIAIEKDKNAEIIPQVTDVESLEYNLTSSIYKLSRQDIPKIGILGYDSAVGLDPQQDPIGGFRQLLGQQFTVEPIRIATEGGKTTIDSSYKALIILDDTQKQYDPFELSVIKSYLDKKGKVVFFVDGIWVDEGLNAQPAQHNLFSLLREYGIDVQKNLVLSTSAELVNFGNDLVNIYTPYPLWVKTGLFNTDATYFSNITQLTYPWVSSINVQKKNGYDVKELITTSEQSWVQKDSFSLNPQQIPEPVEEQLNTFIIGAQSIKKDGGEVVVIPSSRFLLNRFYSRGSGNLELGLNILNDLASEGALSGIRQRAVNIYPLPPNLSEQEKNVFKYSNILLLPIVFALYGVYRITRRNRA